MRSRREQVQAHRFVTRRIVSALLSGEPETNDLPMRRLGLAIFGSVMVSAIVFAIVGVYGLLTSSRGQLEPNTLVIEKETGAKYVYLDGRLYPTLNYASARLVLNNPEPTIRSMSQASLRGYPRGLPVGIPDAPDALPKAAALVDLPWRLCQIPGSTASSRPRNQLVIGRDVPGGVALGEDAVLVSDGDDYHLLTHDMRFRLADRTTMVALGFSVDQAIPASAPLLNALRAGPDLRSIAIADEGKPAPVQIGAKSATIGQLFRVSGQYYLLTRDGLAAIGEVTARLKIAGGAKVAETTAQAVAGNLSSEKLEPEGFPQQVPTLHSEATAGTAICVTYADSRSATLELFRQIPAALEAATAVPTSQGSQDAVVTVDGLVLEGGHGALIRPASPSGEPIPGGTVFLLTERGVKYPLGGDAQIALGYGDVPPTVVPADLIALVPTGPTLDTESARRFIDANGEPALGQ